MTPHILIFIVTLAGGGAPDVQSITEEYASSKACARASLFYTREILKNPRNRVVFAACIRKTDPNERVKS